MKTQKDLKTYFDRLHKQYNQPDFISCDPISIPHRFSKLQDIEISGFWTAMLSWGNRKTIINKAIELMDLMDNAPHDFVLNHSERDRRRFESFKHRTFQYEDTLYFLHFLQKHYRQHNSMEHAFASFIDPHDPRIKDALTGFHQYFFDDEMAPQRTRKHIATPARGSCCKRLNMFLRWMVRVDDAGVDFGLWTSISPSWLMLPLDVHVDRVARQYGLIQRKAKDWKTVVELTEFCRRLDPNDPVKYDFVLFNLGLTQLMHQKE